MSTEYFFHELREFRQSSGLNRKEMAKLLGVSDYTVRSWENGKSTPQSSTLWGILDHLTSPEISRIARRANIPVLRQIVEDYARSLELSPVERYQSKLLRIERTLSDSILKAAQTDFEYDNKSRKLTSVPFVSDLALFEASEDSAVKFLLEDASESAEKIVVRLENVNIEQRYISDTLSDYAAQCKLTVPNPRILERKGGLVRYVYGSEDIGKSVNHFILKEIEQFLDIHNELMRGLFGDALTAARLVISDKVSDDIIGNATLPFNDAKSSWSKFKEIPEKALSIVRKLTKAFRQLSRILEMKFRSLSSLPPRLTTQTPVQFESLD